MRMTWLVLALGWACVASGQSQLLTPTELCEQPLHKLVDLLEEREKLSFETRVTELPGDKGAYSSCHISSTMLESKTGSSYFVYRHTDNVTVYVYKSVGNTATFVLYGPFHSAYRK